MSHTEEGGREHLDLLVRKEVTSRLPCVFISFPSVFEIINRDFRGRR